MLTEYNGLDSQSCSFDKPNLHVSITQESNTSLIPLAYALGVLCIMVGWACVLNGLLYICRLTDKNTVSATWKLATEHEVPEQNISELFWQQIPYRLPWEQTRANTVRGSKCRTAHNTAALLPSVATSSWVMFVFLYDQFDDALCNSDRQRRIIRSMRSMKYKWRAWLQQDVLLDVSDVHDYSKMCYWM